MRIMLCKEDLSTKARRKPVEKLTYQDFPHLKHCLGALHAAKTVVYVDKSGVRMFKPHDKVLK